MYAGRSEDLSFDATLAPLAAATRKHPVLTEAATALIPASPADPDVKPAPVFVTLTSGLGALPGTLAKASGAQVRTSAMVRELARTPDGWRLTIGSAAGPEYLAADAVILACPATPAARLLNAPAPDAARALAEIPYASMAIITLAYKADALPATGRSGYLVSCGRRQGRQGGDVLHGQVAAPGQGRARRRNQRPHHPVLGRPGR